MNIPSEESGRIRSDFFAVEIKSFESDSFDSVISVVISIGRRPVGDRPIDMNIPEYKAVHRARTPFHTVPDVSRGLIYPEINAIFKSILDINVFKSEITEMPSCTVLDGNTGAVHFRIHISSGTNAPNILEMDIGTILIGLPTDLNARATMVIPNCTIFAHHITNRCSPVPFLALDAECIIVTIGKTPSDTDALTPENIQGIVLVTMGIAAGRGDDFVIAEPNILARDSKRGPHVTVDQQNPVHTDSLAVLYKHRTFLSIAAQDAISSYLDIVGVENMHQSVYPRPRLEIDLTGSQL